MSYTRHRELAKKLDTEAEANLAKLPAHCYGTLPGGSPEHDELIIIKRGEEGYYPTEGYATNSLFPTFGHVADLLNSKMDVTKAQRAAMEAGSMFGWHVPGADPDQWDEEGHLK